MPHGQIASSPAQDARPEAGLSGPVSSPRDAPRSAPCDMTAPAAKLADPGQAAEADEPAIEPGFVDRRFRDPLWKQEPFRSLAAAQLAAEAQWKTVAKQYAGLNERQFKRLEFLGSVALNSLSPVNFPWTNPEVIAAAWQTGGMNFLSGAAILAEDATRAALGDKPKGMECFRVGETIAITPGDIIFRNELMEIIQYRPVTAEVHREPVLIVPAWIMKYYILDLAPPNSLVRYLVSQGFTVFIISWKNPEPGGDGSSIDDYVQKGVFAALEAIRTCIPAEKIHAVGYCLGGVVLTVATAAMNSRGGGLASLSLLATQTDFTETADLTLFLDEIQLSILEDAMQISGGVDIRQMAGLSYLMRAKEMSFATLVRRYLLAEPKSPTDIDAWMADPPRTPARAQRQFLHQLVLDNSLATGTYRMDGHAEALKDIDLPLFLLGAERDHAVPWRSVYKSSQFSSADTTFVLTGGGHTAGVVSPPGKARAHYRVLTGGANARKASPDAWYESAPEIHESWWPDWVSWLKTHSAKALVAAPAMSGCKNLPPLARAPGLYVLES
ncbi:MAG: alpha/beta fold hydrolase [Beijerinckiaceae bacterium]